MPKSGKNIKEPLSHLAYLFGRPSTWLGGHLFFYLLYVGSAEKLQKSVVSCQLSVAFGLSWQWVHCLLPRSGLTTGY